jgi:aminocarboxymuconate-semialdehyde decarboxylase
MTRAETRLQHRIVDVHAHCLPAELDELLLGRHGIDVLLRPKLTSPEAAVSDWEEDVLERLRLMDEAGVAVQVLSVPPPPLLRAEADAVQVAQLANDAHAALVACHPERFRAFAHLPLPHLDASLRELHRAVVELDLAGVAIGCSFGDVSAAAEEFDPLYERINELGKPVFFHPVMTGLCSPLLTDFGLQGPLGALLEDSALATQLVVRQLPLRYPRVAMIVPHLGGVMPLYLERMNNQLGRAMPDAAMRPADVARLLYYDTVSHSSTVALHAACRSLGADRLLLGSDYPALEYFERYPQSVEYVRQSGLGAVDVDAILGGNAASLFSWAR